MTQNKQTENFLVKSYIGIYSVWMIVVLSMTILKFIGDILGN